MGQFPDFHETKACFEIGKRGGREARWVKETGRKEKEEWTSGKYLHDGARERERERSQSGFLFIGASTTLPHFLPPACHFLLLCGLPGQSVCLCVCLYVFVMYPCVFVHKKGDRKWNTGRHFGGCSSSSRHVHPWATDIKTHKHSHTSDSQRNLKK